jgi:hypothetical protein
MGPSSVTEAELTQNYVDNWNLIPVGSQDT